MRPVRRLVAFLALLPVLIAAAPAEAEEYGGLTAGEAQSCVITRDGLKCWGSRAGGAFGDGLESPDAPTAVATGLRGVYPVAAATTGSGDGAFACAARLDRFVKCWGAGDDGQLGDGHNRSSSTPVEVVGLTQGYVFLAPGAGYACARDGDGAVKCWGHAPGGQDSSVAEPVAGLDKRVNGIAAGRDHACARRDGEISCWGANDLGQLGSPGPSTAVPRPVVDLPGTALDVAAGTDFTCARTTTGVYCWGSNESGRLGADSAVASSVTPLPVVDHGGAVTQLAAGDAHACVLRGTSEVRCWGAGANGRLGDGGMSDSGKAVTVRDLPNGIDEIAAGGAHTCAAVGERVFCWGSNAHGQLGNPDAGTASPVPVRVKGLVPDTPENLPVCVCDPPPPRCVCAPPPPSPPPPCACVAPPRATISTIAGDRKVTSTRRVTLARVYCPAGATCGLSVPKTVRLKIAGRAYTTKVLAPKTLAGGKRVDVRLQLTKTAATRLRHRTARVTITVAATTSGASTTTLVVKATIRR